MRVVLGPPLLERSQTFDALLRHAQRYTGWHDLPPWRHRPRFFLTDEGVQLIQFGHGRGQGQGRLCWQLGMNRGEPIGDGLMGHVEPTGNAAESIPFEIQFQGLCVSLERMSVHIRGWGRVMAARFAAITLTPASIESGFYECFRLAVGAFWHAYVLLHLCKFSHSQ